MLNNDRAQYSIREKGKQDKLARIEAAARRLFASKGYEKTTTREIAERARIGTGTLFVYFPEKLDLLVYLYRQELERTIDGAFDALPAELPLTDAAVRVFDALYDTYEKDKALARIFIKEILFADRERPMFELGVRLINRLGALVTAAQARGEVRRTVIPFVVGTHLFSVYYFGLINWLTGNVPERAQLRMSIAMALDQLMHGLAAPANRS
jgi:AcrR family transcriptional regulator